MKGRAKATRALPRSVVCAGSVVHRRPLLQQRGLLGREPPGVGRLVGQPPEDAEAEDDGHGPLDQEHPLPAVHVTGAGELHQGSADGSAQDERDAHGEIDDPHHGHSLRLGEPEGHDVHQCGVETGLGGTEQEPQDVERLLALHEHHRGAERAPGDSDPRDPPARADLVHEQVAGHLEQGVAQEEDPGAQAVGGRADPHIGLERRLGQPDVGAVDEGHEVDQAEHRHQVQRGLPAGSGVEQVRAAAG